MHTLRRNVEVNKKRVAIAIPASIISDTPHLRERTAKIGLIARAAAIFRVDQIVVFNDSTREKQKLELDLIVTLLSYMEMPQYLRKHMFKLDPKLQFVGILPPLRTPHHPVSGKARDLEPGEYREGLVLSATKEGMLVDIGVEKQALLREKQYDVGRRLTVQVVKAKDGIEVQSVNRRDVPDYWGYEVTVARQSLSEAVKEIRADLTIGTSKKGNEFAKISAKLWKSWKQAKSILVVFGSPAKGLFEIAVNEGIDIERLLDYIVNTVPTQGTETVRTEEAVFASLAVLNVELGFNA